MGKKRDDEEVTQQIRVGREALDEAVRESQAAAKRIQSSVPPQARDTEDEVDTGTEGIEAEDTETEVEKRKG